MPKGVSMNGTKGPMCGATLKLKEREKNKNL